MENDEQEETQPRKNSHNIIIALILLIIFVLILILFLYLIRRPALFGSFAQSENNASSSVVQGTTPTLSQSVSYDNSYLFASPLRANLGGERIRITAYVLDEQGMGIGGKKVVLGQSSEMFHIYPISDITDSSGRAAFDVISDQAGVYTIEASVDAKIFSQRVTVTFE